MKNLASTLLLSSLLVTACSKKDPDPQPTPSTPAQAATVNVAFDNYATASQPASTESLSLLATKPTYQAFSDRLEVKLEVANVLGLVQDRVLLVLPIGRQRNGLVGTYTLASQPDASLGEVLVTYRRPSNSNSAYDNVYGSNTAKLEGSFTITGYDASRRLLSGSYAVKALNVKTPFSFIGAGSGDDPRRSGDLRLGGTFQELPAQ